MGFLLELLQSRFSLIDHDAHIPTSDTPNVCIYHSQCNLLRCVRSKTHGYQKLMYCRACTAGMLDAEFAPDYISVVAFVCKLLEQRRVGLAVL